MSVQKIGIARWQSKLSRSYPFFLAGLRQRSYVEEKDEMRKIQWTFSTRWCVFAWKSGYHCLLCSAHFLLGGSICPVFSLLVFRCIMVYKQPPPSLHKQPTVLSDIAIYRLLNTPYVYIQIPWLSRLLFLPTRGGVTPLTTATNPCAKRHGATILEPLVISMFQPTELLSS